MSEPNDSASALSGSQLPIEGPEISYKPDGDEGDETSQASYNIADAIGQPDISHLFSVQQLKDIGRDCVANFEIDDTNFNARRERIEQFYKLALQVKETKN